MADDDFNIQRARDLETVYKAGKMPPAMKADYEKVRPKLRERLQDEDRTLIGAVGEGLTNIPESGLNFVEAVAQPFMHPIATGEAIANLGEGVAEKVGRALGIGSGGEHEQYADAVWDMLKERYGGWRQIKKTLAKDPVGFLADASLLAGGGAAALKATGTAGKLASGLEKVSRATDPIRLGAKALQMGGRGVAEMAIAPMTNTGGISAREAAGSGFRGGQSGKDFRAALRETTSPEEMVNKARNAVSNMEAMQKFEYVRDMKRVNRSPVVLSFNDVDTALDDMEKAVNYRGRFGTGPAQVKSPEAEAIYNKIRTLVDHYKNLRATHFQTAEGFDILKQTIGELEATPGSLAEKIRTQAYTAVRDTIARQEPEYGRIMKAYEQTAGLVKELERTLSLGKNATTDTAFRKLMSALRNNVNTNFGRRKELTDRLIKAGAPHLMEELAGASMSGLMPHGLSRLLIGGEAGGLLFFHHPYLIPLLLAAHSPRIVGETLHGAGRVAGAMKPLRPALPAAYQAGRAKQEEERRSQLPHVTVRPTLPQSVGDALENAQ